MNASHPHRRWGMRLGLGLLVVAMFLGIFGPFLPGPDPIAQDLARAVEPPSWSHPLGTDSVGRDVLARLLHGAPRSLGLALACVVVATAAGMLLGLVAAYTGGVTDVAIMRLADLTLAFPGMLLGLLLAGFLGGGTMPMLIGIKFALWPQFTRLTRSLALRTLAEPHVEAAELAGFRPGVILRRHVVPTVLPHVITLATLGIGTAIMSISALGFLGLGIQPPDPEWGAMINDALPYLSEAPVQIAAPCVAIFVCVLGFTLVGEALVARIGRSAHS